MFKVYVLGVGCVIDSWGRGVGPRVWIIGVWVILIEWCGDSRSPWVSIWLKVK